MAGNSRGRDGRGAYALTIIDPKGMLLLVSRPMGYKERVKAIRAMKPSQRAHARATFDGEMYLRATAVAQQARRLREQGQTGPEYMVDGWLFAEAVRATIRAGEIGLLLRESKERERLDEALQRVKELIPEAREVRDALEHFDDYLLGVGQKQQPGYSYSQVYERGTHLRVRVGPWTLDVDDAERAATHLASVMLAGRDFTEVLQQ